MVQQCSPVWSMTYTVTSTGADLLHAVTLSRCHAVRYVWHIYPQMSHVCTDDDDDDDDDDDRDGVESQHRPSP